MEFIIIFLAVILVVLLFVWQGKVLFKYLKCDVLKIDTVNRIILVNNQTISFSDIRSVSIEIIETPSFTERYFTRYAHNHTMYKIIFFMNNGAQNEYIVNSTGILYKYLSILNPYVKINADIEEYKPKFVDGPIIFGIILTLIYFLFKFMGK